MKLGISYVLFSGEELLEYAIRPNRKNFDFVSVVYQTTSYFGKPCSDELLPTLQRLLDVGLVDEIVEQKNDPSLQHQRNEVMARVRGLELSRDRGCTHHISADVDEMYDPEQLVHAKESFGGDSSVAKVVNYFKSARFLVVPPQNHFTSFIQPVSTSYDVDVKFAHPVDRTRRPSKSSDCKVFSPEELVVHHMSYVRKDIRKKLESSGNGWLYDVDEFEREFREYRLGGRVRIAPEKVYRRTVLVDDRFGIPDWE